jgi:KDO2-lipid IV(A) lauroyltransferase
LSVAVERRPTWLHRVEYSFLRTIMAAGLRVSEPAAERMGVSLGRLAHSLGIRRKLVDNNLALAFPEKDEAWRRNIALASYQHLGCELMWTLRMSALTRAELADRSELVGAEQAIATLTSGKGVVVVAGHFGNWGLGASIPASRGIPIDIVAQRLSNPLVDRHIGAVRRGFGVGVIDRKQATREAVRALREGRAVVFAADQDARSTGVFVPFFGKLASTHRGPAVLALRTGLPIALAMPRRGADGRFRVYVEDIDVSREGTADEVVYRITAAFTARLEAAVREHPEQYLWHHRRWKTAPPRE